MTDETRQSPAETVSRAGFTEADFNSWKFNRDAVHFNGGKVFFGWGHRCVTQPRLLVIDKYFKADRSTQRSYVIDGETTCLTLLQALVALSAPVKLSDVERELLPTVPREWARYPDRLNLITLAEKGLVEWGRDAENKVTCRLTEAGTKQLTASQRPDDGKSQP